MGGRKGKTFPPSGGKEQERRGREGVNLPYGRFKTLAALYINSHTKTVELSKTVTLMTVTAVTSV